MQISLPDRSFMYGVAEKDVLKLRSFEQLKNYEVQYCYRSMTKKSNGLHTLADLVIDGQNMLRDAR